MILAGDETFWTLLHDKAHWEFEIFLMILFDGLVFGLMWNYIKKHWQHHLDRDKQDEMLHVVPPSCPHCGKEL